MNNSDAHEVRKEEQDKHVLMKITSQAQQAECPDMEILPNGSSKVNEKKTKNKDINKKF